MFVSHRQIWLATRNDTRALTFQPLLRPGPRLVMLDNINGGLPFWEVNPTRYTETQIDVRASETEVHSAVNLVSVYSSARGIRLLPNKCQKCVYYC